MGTAIALGNVICKGQNRFMIAVIPPHRHFDADLIPLTCDKDWLGHDRVLGAVKIFNEFFYTALIKEFAVQRLGWALIFKDNPHARV